MTDDTDGVVSLMMEETGAPAAAPVGARAEAPALIRMRARDVNVSYGEKQALFDVDIDLAQNKVTALIGPSGCGKSTFLRCLNRMNDIIDICRVTGSITLDDRDIYSRDIDVVQLRARVGMVFQKPNPFPKSIYENVAYGPRIHGLASKGRELDDVVEQSLRRAGLFDEVSDRLQQPGTSLSGGQQQRLCIARAIAISPEVILMDEPCSALDPIATAKVEELIDELREHYTTICSRPHGFPSSPRSSTWASWWSSRRPSRSSPIRTISGRRTTSPGASAKQGRGRRIRRATDGCRAHGQGL